MATQRLEQFLPTAARPTRPMANGERGAILPMYTPQQMVSRNIPLAEMVRNRLEVLHTLRQGFGAKDYFLQMIEAYSGAHKVVPVEENGQNRKIHYLDTGALSEENAKKEPMLVLPGVTNGVQEQLPLVSTFSHKRSIVIDYTTLRPETASKDILRVLQSAGIEDPIKVLAVSMGATYAQHFLAEYPDKVMSVVAWAPVLLGGKAYGGRDFHILDWLNVHRDAIPWFPVRTGHDITSRTRFRRFGGRGREMSEVDTSYRDVVRTASRRHLRSSGKDKRFAYLNLLLNATKESRGECENTLGIYDIPVTVLRAHKDKVIKETDYQGWKNHFPNTRIVEVDSKFGHHSIDNISSQVLPAMAVALDS